MSEHHERKGLLPAFFALIAVFFFRGQAQEKLAKARMIFDFLGITAMLTKLFTGIAIHFAAITKRAYRPFIYRHLLSTYPPGCGVRVPGVHYISGKRNFKITRN